MRLNEQLTDIIAFDGHQYELNMSFDNVLTLFDMLADDELTEFEKLNGAIILLIGHDIEVDWQTKQDIFEAVFKQAINSTSDDDVSYDLAGNPMPNTPSEQEKDFDLKQDADLIFASFLFDYKIDLFEQQGKMHWKKFIALLNNLSSETPLSRIREIRNYHPNKHDSAEYKEKMQKLKRRVALREEGDYG